MIQEKLLGNIGLNKDDDPRYFGDNDTDHILNMLPDTDESGGLLKTLDGNAEIPTNIDWVLTSSRKVIGTCKRADNDIIYYFVKGLSIHGSETTTTTPMGFDPESELDFEYNSIIEFNPLSGTFRVIVFEEEHLYMGDWVVGAMVFGDYIIYNSGSHGMRKVHIEYAYRYYNGVAGDTYPEIISTTFALRNMPPIDRPTCEYRTDSERAQNNIINKTFQFAYRYKYREGGYSVYSEFSDICLSPNIERWNGEYVSEQFDNNYLRVTFTRGDDIIISAVEIIVREGNTGDWRFFSSISDNVNYIDFYNDEDYESVDQDEVNKIEDAIPREVADAALVNENRLVLARVTEGFNPVELDVTMAAVPEEIYIENDLEASISKHYIQKASLPNNGFGIDLSEINIADYPEGTLLRMNIKYDVTYTPTDYELQAADVVSNETLSQMVALRISALGFLPAPSYAKNLTAGNPAAAWNTGLCSQANDVEIQTDGGYIISSASYIEFIDPEAPTSNNKWNTYKSGAVHPHAIQYWDEEFRRTTIMRSAACDVVVPERSFFAEPQSVATTAGWDVGMDYRIGIDWTISHLAPSWARYWSWVYAGNKTQSWFIQYIINSVSLVSGYLRLDITPLQKLKTDSVAVPMYNSIIDPYAFVEGDRIRILTGAPEGGYLGDGLQGEDYYDLPVADLEADELLIASPEGDFFGLAPGSLIEIYTPKTFDEEFASYYLVGKINSVIGRYHMNPDGTSQSAGVAAAGTLNSGDAYVIGRAFSETSSETWWTTGTQFAVESMHWSDYYQSDAYDRGKPNVYSSLGEITLNNIRWGWKHFEGTSVDNMFTFDPLDYKPLTDIYGDVVRIGEMGDVLKVIFERKVASMYIGKREVYDASGSVFTVQDSVLSNPNYSLEDYGTTDPRAVLFVRGYCYFIDFNAGAVVRNTNNGSYPISGKVDAGGEGADYKMHSYFRDICALALRYGTSSYNVILGWDDGRKVLLVSILKYGCNDYTAVFRESRGRWVSLLELMTDPDADEVFYPTCFQWAGNKFYSWLDGSDSVWLHTYVAATPLSIYGDPKTAQINIWGTAQPNMIKVFDSIAIHTNARGWSGIVAIPESLSYPNGMYSILPESGFEVREGVLYAPYLDNLGTTGAYSVASLYNGESLRGYVIGNQLSISDEAWLFKVDINWRPSNV